MTPGIKHALREATLWLSVMTASAAVVYFFDDIVYLVGSKNSSALVLMNQEAPAPKPDLQPQSDGFDRQVILRAQENGHYYSKAEINGRSVPVLVDTGATFVSLPYEDAEKAGIRLHRDDFKYRTQTANGSARVARVWLDQVRIGDITVRDVEAAVSEPGASSITLLGMSFLGKLSNIQLEDRTLILTQ